MAIKLTVSLIYFRVENKSECSHLATDVPTWHACNLLRAVGTCQRECRVRGHTVLLYACICHLVQRAVVFLTVRLPDSAYYIVCCIRYAQVKWCACMPVLVLLGCYLYIQLVYSACACQGVLSIQSLSEMADGRSSRPSQRLLLIKILINQDLLED